VPKAKARRWDVWVAEEKGKFTLEGGLDAQGVVSTCYVDW
jgi:hypothetical protein